MLARVLLVLLAGLPACRGGKETSYPTYETNEDNVNADFYDSYNDELKTPPDRTTVVEVLTRIKRRDLEDIRTLNPEEINDVKGALNDILQGKKPEPLKELKSNQDYTDTYDYIENSDNARPGDIKEMKRSFNKWLPTIDDKTWSPAVEKQEKMTESGTQKVSEQHLTFEYKPETPTNKEIKDHPTLEVYNMPAWDGEVPAEVPTGVPITTEDSEETEATVLYPQETTTYSNPLMQAKMNKLVQHWQTSSVEDSLPVSRDTHAELPATSPYNSTATDTQTRVKNLVLHWSPSGIVQHQDPSMPPETAPYNRADMQAEVKKLVQHWSTDGSEQDQGTSTLQETSSYNSVDMQAEVKKLVQQWSPSGSEQEQGTSPPGTPPYNIADMQAEVKKLVQHWIPNGTEQDQGATTPVTPSYNSADMQAEVKKFVQHWSPSGSELEQSTTTQPETSPPNSADMQAEVKKFVQHWSPSGSEQEQGTSTETETSTYDSAIMRAEVKKLVHNWSPSDNVEHQEASMEKFPISERPRTSPDNSADMKEVWKPPHVPVLQQWRPSSSVQPWNPYMAKSAKIEMNDQKPGDRSSIHVQRWSVPDNAQHFHPDVNVKPSNDPHWRASNIVPDQSSAEMIHHFNRTLNVQDLSVITSTEENDYLEPDTTKAEMTTDHLITVPVMREMDGPPTLPPGERPAMASDKVVPPPAPPATNDTLTTTDVMTTDTATTTTTTPKPQVDIDAIMAIISNLTYDYEWNLTEQFNKSIIDHGIPTCSWEKWGPGGAWTLVENTTTVSYDFENASVVNKCFVCGLHDNEIPRNAHCSDAFAGDFLPLMPSDARSRGKVAGFRKYCRYMDIQNFVEDPHDPRSIYGRFTGGCAVRWNDITGVYTQRTCRSRFRPLMGKHFASKRMAKLELALVNVDNGCIVSPMATLLPVSRGISLYARFHACVCSTNWCNRATLVQLSFNTLVTTVLVHWLAHS